MSDNTVYLITGASRGIGLAIVTLLLTRPNTTVLATSRSRAPSIFTTPFPGGTIHPTSKLLPVLLDDTDAAIASDTLAARLRDEFGVTRLDVVIANAAGSVEEKLRTVLDADPSSGGELERDLGVNTLGTVRLFRAVWPLLERAGGDGGEGGELGRFVLISSTLGSIGVLEEESMPGMGYGMSKAAANWWAKKVSVELKGRLVVGVLHPGWVKTYLGQTLADAIGYKEPPMTVEESARRVVAQIDGLTAEKSGKFLSHDGTELPW